MRLRSRQTRVLALTAAVGLGVPLAMVTGASAPAIAAKVPPPPQLSFKQLSRSHGESEGKAYFNSRERYLEARYLAGTSPLSPEQAAHYRAAAASKYGRTPHAAAAPQRYLTASTVTPAWSSIGPSSVYQVGRTTYSFQKVSGRVSALAVNNQGEIYAGGAQGGLWRYDPVAQQWTALTDNLPTLSVGAVAIAPSNQNIVYLATGEADLSGDSYYGDGIWKSTDAGNTWTHVSGSKFNAATISRLLVDPKNPNKLYVATIRGRGGARRVSPPTNQTWGIYRSTTGGRYWTLLKGTKNASHGATDLEFDPNHAGVLYATFWNDGLYKSDPSERFWKNLNSNLAGAISPTPTFAASRMSIATANLGGGHTRIYAGFDWYNAGNGTHRPSRLFRSDNGGATWTMPGFGTPGDPDAVLNYCDIQCTYDNVVEVDPSDPDTVYAAGEYNYNNSPQLGGVYMSRDAGAHWVTLGVDLHPDFHALAVQPNDPAHIVVGNDGGVWDSPDRGGRQPGPIADCLTAYFSGDGTTPPPCTDWVDRNKGLGIAQSDSVDYANADNPDTFWEGTQDNGTQSTLPAVGWPGYATRWMDQTSGDGGQVVVDHNNPNFVFGTYYNLTGLYRFDSAQDTLNTFHGLPTFSNANIMNGIDTRDRSEFYIPLIQNQGNSNQLFTGTSRVYRSDNAETPVASDVQWQPISDDLTSGCTGSASNGGRACVISALGISDGGTGGYAGTEEGWVWHASDATTSTGNADWVRSDPSGSVLPGRPVGGFAVDRSNWRVAYVSFAGYNAATPGHNGHVFKTTDGGQAWTDVTGNLPDNPVNSILLDPSDANTLYAGSDVGAFVTHDGGAHWAPIGSGLPRVQVYQLAYDPSRALLVAGTHGRGAWTLSTGAQAPALVASITDPGTPVGPGSDLPYTITVKNIGNADATGVTVTDPVPGHTTVGADQVGDGGSTDGTTITWSGLTIPAGGSQVLHVTATIDPNLDSSVTEIVNDGLHVTSDQGASTSGSPHVTPIAPQYAADVTPTSEVRTAQLTTTATFSYTVRNAGYTAESFDLSKSGDTWSTVIEPDCQTAGTATAVLQPGDTQQVCVQVTVPGTANSQDTDVFHLTVQPDATTDTSGAETVDGTTVAVTHPVLLVDEDGNNPDVQSYYTDALTAAGIQYDVFDLSTTQLPDGYLSGYSSVYWFTGTSYPGPLMPYEKQLTNYLDNGGRLFASGMDALDQSAGTTSFVHNYLHINWDGTDTMNDRATSTFTGVTGSVIGDGFGSVDKTAVTGEAAYEDEITPIDPATPQFMDDGSHSADGQPHPDGLAVAAQSGTGNTYKVVFLSFPFEEFGSATDRQTLVEKVNTFFGS
ncbi:MAG TPA: hypothetical protein VFH66_08840 [Mycobacteriales bacterium]|nr:hypothetical protein [Mycobacteriales bacterium]